MSGDPFVETAAHLWKAEAREILPLSDQGLADIRGRLDLSLSYEKLEVKKDFLESLLARLANAEADNQELKRALNQTIHYLILDANGWFLEHLVSCRPNLGVCEIHEAVNQDSEMFRAWNFGRYKVWLDESGELVIGDEEND